MAENKRIDQLTAATSLSTEDLFVIQQNSVAKKITGAVLHTFFERIANKITSLSSASTDTQYPSAKCVYDNLVLKENLSNKVTSMSTSSTDTQYPSAKAVNDQLVLKELLSNKVTSLSSSNTDTQYPSAKCVYDVTSAKVDRDSSSLSLTIGRDSTGFYVVVPD